jgi:hypothetical protein
MAIDAVGNLYPDAEIFGCRIPIIVCHLHCKESQKRGLCFTRERAIGIEGYTQRRVPVDYCPCIGRFAACGCQLRRIRFAYPGGRQESRRNHQRRTICVRSIDRTITIIIEAIIASQLIGNFRGLAEWNRAILCATRSGFLTLAEVITAGCKQTRSIATESLIIAIDATIIGRIDAATDRVRAATAATIIATTTGLLSGTIDRAGQAILAIPGLAEAVAAERTTDLRAIVRTVEGIFAGFTETVVITIGRIIDGLKLTHHFMIFVIEKMAVIRANRPI